MWESVLKEFIMCANCGWFSCSFAVNFPAKVFPKTAETATLLTCPASLRPRRCIVRVRWPSSPTPPPRHHDVAFSTHARRDPGRRYPHFTALSTSVGRAKRLHEQQSREVLTVRRCRRWCRHYLTAMAVPVACTRFSDNYDLKEELGK